MPELFVTQQKYGLDKLTRLMRSLASAETGGFEGKVRSTFTILQSHNHIYAYMLVQSIN